MFTLKCERGELGQHVGALIEKLSPHEFKIVEAIHHKVESLEDDEKGPVRTELVLKVLDDLGQQFGYEVRGKHCSSSEWLLDCVWLINREKSWSPQGKENSNNKWEKFEGIKLACESEWHGHEEKVLEDFVKLTVVKADFRLFIHSNQYYGNDINTVDLCKAVIPHSAGDRYLFIGFDQRRKNTQFRVDFINT